MTEDYKPTIFQEDVYFFSKYVYLFSKITQNLSTYFSKRQLINIHSSQKEFTPKTRYDAQYATITELTENE